MKGKWYLILISVFIGFCFVLPVQAGPQLLGNNALDQVTAGRNGGGPGYYGDTDGGAIVAGNSEARINEAGAVTLTGSAQQELKGLNVVTAADAQVANGVNVESFGKFDAPPYQIDDGQISQPSGESRGPGGRLPYVESDQGNRILQVSGGGADLDEYAREGYDVIIDADAQYKQTKSLSINNDLEYATIKGELHRFTYDGKVTVDGVYNEETGETTGYGQGFVGQGFAAYGSEDWTETASAECAQDSSGSSSNYATNSGGTGTDEYQYPTSWYDQTSGGQSENSQASSGAYDWSDTYSAQAGAAGFNGAGCAAGDGASCTGSQSATATYAQVDATYLKDVFNLEANEETTLDVDIYAEFRAPIFIDEAEAEYIVVDDSKLIVNSVYGISLAGSAQSSLKGLNVVNAAGGQVANGVNVSELGNMAGKLKVNFNQHNSITQIH